MKLQIKDMEWVEYNKNSYRKKLEYPGYGKKRGLLSVKINQLTHDPIYEAHAWLDFDGVPVLSKNYKTLEGAMENAVPDLLQELLSGYVEPIPDQRAEKLAEKILRYVMSTLKDRSGKTWKESIDDIIKIILGEE